MDALLGRFLSRVRPRSRATNLVAFEDAVVALDDYLRGLRRSAGALGPRDVSRFLGYWALRQGRVPGGGARRFCAAVQVLIRDLARDAGGARGGRLRAAAAEVARETARVARATELLDGTPFDPVEPDGGSLDGYWVLVLRGESHAVVRAVGTRALVGPVLLPAPVLRLLGPGAVINMRIVPVAQHWCVVEHGPCYPAAAVPALRGVLQPATA